MILLLIGDNRSQHKINVGQLMYYRGLMNIISSSRVKHDYVSLSNVSHVKAMYSGSTFDWQTESTFEKQGSHYLDVLQITLLESLDANLNSGGAVVFHYIVDDDGELHTVSVEAVSSIPPDSSM